MLKSPTREFSHQLDDKLRCLNIVFGKKAASDSMFYWASTLIICAMLAASAASNLFHHPTISGIRKLGFPDYFRIQLAILKIIAVPALLIPALPLPIKEWAYAGVALYLITAMVAHAAHRDPIVLNLINVGLSGALIVSYVCMPR